MALAIEKAQGVGMKGYRHKADGTKTTFFDRSHLITATDRAALSTIDTTPKKLEPSTVTDHISTASTGGSAWNAGGTTWEEKDVSKWAKARLTLRLLETIVEDRARTIRVVGLKSAIPGDASVAFVRGRKRYIFNFNDIVLDWRAEAGDWPGAITGSVTLPDVATDCMCEFEMEFKIDNSAQHTAAQRESLKRDLAKQSTGMHRAITDKIKEFIEDYKREF